MKTMQDVGSLLLVLFLVGSTFRIVNCEEDLAFLSDVYDEAVNEGIIDQRNYPFEAFEKDERSIFRDIYKEYRAVNGSETIDYREWLFMTNFGILPDTKESLYMTKISKHSATENKRRFMASVKKGDILITKRSSGGLVGHAAIMITDYWILELPGGSGWADGIPDNNRQIGKAAWYDIQASDWITVYRCPDDIAAKQAAEWADHTYYNPTSGAVKTKHITYKLTSDNVSVNPSYSSKLVIQAYYFGTGSKQVIEELSTIRNLISPATIPSYFLKPYRLINVGKY